MDIEKPMTVDPRQEALKDAVFEARRFIAKAELALCDIQRKSRLYASPDLASAKRSSMDLTRALVKVRNPYT